jgi:putative membrane protein
MKRLIAIAATTLLAATMPALAQSAGEKTGANSALGVAPSTADFVKEVATSDMLEIESSKLAQQNGTPKEKAFASQMVKDHTKTSSELKSLVNAGGVQAQLPSSLDSASQSKLDKLTTDKPNFSSNYDSMQVSAHKDAVSLFERYAKSGDNAKLKGWARKTLPALQHHLQMAQDLAKK